MPVLDRFSKRRRFSYSNGYELGAGTDFVIAPGQSNTSGISAGAYQTSLTDPRISQYGSNGLLVTPSGTPLVFHDIAAGNGEGPLPTFLNLYANWVAPSRNVCVIPTAHAGTGFEANQGAGNNYYWKVDHTPTNENLYLFTLAQIAAAFAAVGAGNHRVAAVVWVQGEADATASVPGPTYQSDLDTLIDSIRRDTATPFLPFVIGQMVPWYPNDGTQPTRADIDAVHQATPQRKLYTGFAYGVTNQATYGANNDHYNVPGNIKQGWMIFQAFLEALANDGTAQQSPQASMRQS